MNKSTTNGGLLQNVESLLPTSVFSASPSNSDMVSIINMMERLLHWAAVIESSDDAIVSLSVEGLITGWNSAAERLYGYTPVEIIGKPISLLMPSEKSDDFPMIMNRLKDDKRIQHYVTQRKTKTGKIIDVSITASPIKDSRGNLIGASKIAHDISEQRENERRRDEFVSTVSHELKTPISSQKIYGELLAQQIKKNGDDQLMKLIDKVNQQTLKLEKLVNDLLELSRFHMGRIKMEYQQFDLSQLIQDVIDDMQKTTAHRIETKSKKLLLVHGDRDRIGQVMINLLANAIKYSPDTKKIIVDAKLVKDEVIVSIQDFGIGISPEYRDKIFERFFRINGEDETTYPGMGIGLNFSSEIIDLHHGRMWVESEVDVGSTFHFSIPAMSDSPSEEGR